MDKKTIIAVDAMGGENSPDKILNGISLFLKDNKNIYFKLFGDQSKIEEKINKYKNIKNFCEIIHADQIIKDDESPLVAAKKNNTSSMWKAIESQKNEGADITLSAGNTGALLVLSRLILRMINNVEKPALAGLWPNKIGMNIVLDLGANIECNEKNLVDFSKMGAALYKALYPTIEPKVALLNVGLEEIKGNDVVKNAYQILQKTNSEKFEFNGYIEGNHIMDGDSNVIVTDGFTGNIALKTAEGTANFIINELKNTMFSSFFGKISSLLNLRNLKKFKKRLDPRLYNGAIFIGLDSPVVKSHGGTDYIGFSNSLSVCGKIIKGNLIKKIKENIN
jgi:glycerol-3-phosphate acyltransferase PlsX